MSAAAGGTEATERWPLGYGMWLRTVCAILGMGGIAREAMAGMLFEAYAAGTTPIAAALGLRPLLEKQHAERNGGGTETV